MATMNPHDHLAAVRREGEALLTTAAPALTAAVPTCPGWSCERLVGHIGRTWRWTAGWVTTGASPDLERAPAGADVVPWARAGLDELVAVLDALDPAATVETWLGPRPAAFWPRRMAMEAALHRVDAQSAVGAVTPIDLPLAVDGVDELFEAVLLFAGTGDLDRRGQTVHLHATDPELADDDGAGEWLVTLDPDEVRLEHAHAKGDVAVRGPASDLYLLLWNRRGAEGLQVFGDERVLADWRTHVTV
jgi:uncharacterized protein (TIGR03083 family)